MIVRYYNANILTDGKIVKGDLITYDNLIACVGDGANQVRFDKEIDVKGNLIIPTLKNVHTHSPMTFLRGMADDMPLNKWLNTKVFVAEKYLVDEYVYWLQKLAILEYLRNGIGLISDMYMFKDPIAYASSECGIRNTLVFGINDAVLKSVPFEKAIDNSELIKEANKNAKSKLIDAKLGLHAEYTCSKVLLEKISEVVNDKKEGIFLHMNESEGEVKGCIERYGLTPPQLFESLGLFNNGGTLYHMVHNKKEDLQIIKNRNINVVTCPASNLKLANGIAPIKEMLDMGINVALGTDGPASNNSLDMFKEMYLLALLQKSKNNDATAMPAQEAIKIATTNGAKALGRKGIEGLRTGQYADFVIIDINKPNMRPHNDLISSLVYSCGVDNVISTVIDGKILYENGEYHIGEDVEKIYRMCEGISREISRKVNV